MGAYIMPGVNIGNGVTIAANSVVTRDVSDYTVIAGVSANVIKVKYAKYIIYKLNNIAWWNWKESIIKERVSGFYNSTDFFVNKYFKNEN
jgi:virginiamycin A acetyltransferase